MQVISRCVLVLSALTLNDCSKDPDAKSRPVLSISDRQPVAPSVPSEASIDQTSKFVTTALDDPLSLQAASYGITLVADRGSRKGATSDGSLTLAVSVRSGALQT
jgi:hypothetical protein